MTYIVLLSIPIEGSSSAALDSDQLIHNEAAEHIVLACICGPSILSLFPMITFRDRAGGRAGLGWRPSYCLLVLPAL